MAVNGTDGEPGQAACGGARSLLGYAADLLVFAPAGLVLGASEELPRLAEKGRHQVAGQVALARMIGAFVVAQGQRQASERFARMLSASPLGAGTSRVEASSDQVGAHDAGPGSQGPVDHADARGTRAGKAHGGREHLDGPSSAPADLAIPGYDVLSATQVVQRLGGLSADELAAVQEYESAHRARRTVLAKVEQIRLLAEPAS